MQAEIWTKTNCGFCVKAKTLLKQKGVDYKEYVIDTGVGEFVLNEGQVRVTKDQLLEKVPNAKTVPQIWLDGSYVGGYNELEAFWNTNS